MTRRYLCERVHPKIVGKGKFQGGKKYCRRRELYFLHHGLLCPCRGMGLRVSPVIKQDKKRLREKHGADRMAQIQRLS